MARSWAALVADTPEVLKPETARDLHSKDVKVLDANALIGVGAQLSHPSTLLLTTPDAFAEVKDAASRAALEQLDIECKAPSQESLQAVVAFARKTGDLHQLSTTDLQVLALGHTVLSQLYGVAHLRSEPAQVKARRKQSRRGRLPGWGKAGQSAAWDELDAADEDALQTGCSESMVSTDVATDPSLKAKGQPRQRVETEMEAADGGGDDDGGWETARVSRNAFRRAKRKAARRVEHESTKTHSQPLPPGSAVQDEVSPRMGVCEETEGCGADAGVATQSGVADTHCQVDDGGRDEAMCAEGKHSEGNAHDLNENENAAAEGAGGDEGDEEEEEEVVYGEEVDAVVQGGADAEQPSGSNTEEGYRRLAVVTADFAMQNVLLQMGMRLESPNGRRIVNVQRAILRCDACKAPCKVMKKLFCPVCGHATLSRVTVTIGADGVEQYGVRTKFVLKGTRYSLPKPKSGRNKSNPILTEDIYKAKVRKPKKGSAGDAAMDGYDSRLGQLKNHANQPAHIVSGLAHLSTNWRRNPNERKMTMRSNRRR